MRTSFQNRKGHYCSAFCFVLGIIIISANNIYGSSTQLQSGFYLPSRDLGGYFQFVCSQSDLNGSCLQYHLGVDRNCPEGDPVYAVADGEIEWYYSQVCGFLALNPSLGGGAMVIRHRNSEGNYFYALYGHIKNPNKTSSFVKAGEQIAEIGPFYREPGDQYKISGKDCDGVDITYWYASYLPHLHFGINVGSTAPLTHLGYDSTLGSWVDPTTYLNNHHPYLSAAILDQSVYPNTAKPGDILTMVYKINNPTSNPIQNVVLGARIRTSDPQGQWIDDPSNDKMVTLDPGGRDYSRDFKVPETVSPGLYDVAWVIYDHNSGVWIDNKESIKILSIVSSSTPTELYHLSGTLTDANGAPIIGNIYANETTGANLGNSATAALDGNYRMALFPGTYSVYATVFYNNDLNHLEFNIQPQAITINTNTFLNIQVPSYKFYHVTGKVTDASGNGLAWASIQLLGPNETWSSTGTKSDGSYDALVLEGTYTLDVWRPGGSNLSSVRITNVEVHGNIVKNISLSTQFILSGTVTDANGNPIQSWIFADEVHGSNPGGVCWSSDGTYQIPLRPGTYAITSYLETFNINPTPPYNNMWINLPKQTIIINSDATLNIHYPLYKFFHLTGKVTDVNNIGQSVAIDIWDDIGICSSYTITSIDGSYDIMLIAGTYTMKVSAPSDIYPPFEIKKIAITGDTTRNILLSHSYSLRDQAIAQLQPPLNPSLDVFDIISQGVSNIYDFIINYTQQMFQAILNWPGSEMKLTIYRPNGSIYGQYQSKTPPIVVSIPNPEIGTWRCEASAIDVPYDNYPYALVVGMPLVTSISGGAYFYPENPTYKATFSMNVTNPSSPSGWLKYYYARTRMNFVSTGITSISGSLNMATFSGTGTVNNVAGYTFTAMVSKSSPDIFSIVIRKADGSIYYSTGPMNISGGSLTIQ